MKNKKLEISKDRVIKMLENRNYDLLQAIEEKGWREQSLARKVEFSNRIAIVSVGLLCACLVETLILLFK